VAEASVKIRKLPKESERSSPSKLNWIIWIVFRLISAFYIRATKSRTRTERRSSGTRWVRTFTNSSSTCRPSLNCQNKVYTFRSGTKSKAGTTNTWVKFHFNWNQNTDAYWLKIQGRGETDRIKVFRKNCPGGSLFCRLLHFYGFSIFIASSLKIYLWVPYLIWAFIAFL
jgi:hypothetical protein